MSLISLIGAAGEIAGNYLEIQKLLATKCFFSDRIEDSFRRDYVAYLMEKTKSNTLYVKSLEFFTNHPTAAYRLCRVLDLGLRALECLGASLVVKASLTAFGFSNPLVLACSLICLTPFVTKLIASAMQSWEGIDTNLRRVVLLASMTACFFMAATLSPLAAGTAIALGITGGLYWLSEVISMRDYSRSEEVNVSWKVVKHFLDEIRFLKTDRDISETELSLRRNGLERKILELKRFMLERDEIYSDIYLDYQKIFEKTLSIVFEKKINQTLNNTFKAIDFTADDINKLYISCRDLKDVISGFKSLIQSLCKRIELEEDKKGSANLAKMCLLCPKLEEYTNRINEIYNKYKKTFTVDEINKRIENLKKDSQDDKLDDHMALCNCLTYERCYTIPELLLTFDFGNKELWKEVKRIAEDLKYEY